MSLSASERLRKLREQKQEESNNTGSSTTTSSPGERLRELMSPKVEAREKAFYGNKFGIDTLEKDLADLSTNISNIYSGWQTQETLANTKTSIEAMQGRLEKYQNYQQRFGGADLTDLAEGYKTVLGDWDMLSETYGYYQNADAYNTAKQKYEFDKQFKDLTFDDVQQKLKEYKEGTPEYDYLSKYTNYTDLSDYEKAIAWEKGKYTNAKGEIANTEDSLKTLPSAGDLNKALDNFNNRGKVPELDVMGLMGAMADSKNKQPITIADPKEYTSQLPEDAIAEFKNQVGADGNLIDEEYVAELERAYNERKLDNLFDKHKHYMEEEDFKEYSVYDPEIDNQTYKYINDDEYGGQLLLENSNFSTGDIDLEEWELGYDHLTDKERSTYNFLFKKYGEKKAQKFLDDIEPNLRRRKSLKQSDNIKQEIDNGTPLAYAYNAARPMGKLSGSVSSFFGTMWDTLQGKELDPYANYNDASNAASYIQEHTSNRIAELTEGAELFGVNVPAFLYNTASSISDSALGVALTGKAYSLISGSSAFQQKARELTEAGENQDVIWANAVGSGLAEIVFEYLSIDQLLKAKNADDFWSMLKGASKQGGVESLEELFTEDANIKLDRVIRRANSEAEQLRKELLSRGYSEEEASSEIQKMYAKQLAEAAAGGFLSGVSMGGVTSASEYKGYKDIGSQILENDRASEMWNTSANASQESELFDLYTEYANKGINESNISKAQLGNLYNTAEAEADTILRSKKATTTQKTSALITKADLEEVSTSKPAEQRAVEQNLMRMHTGEKTVVDGADVKIEGIRRVEGGTLVKTSQGEVSIDNITFKQNDAELVAHAENMAEDKANLLIEQYDGNADVDAYVDSFNLAYRYGKNGLPEQLALENKGVLTEEQALKTYSNAYAKGVQIKQTQITQINVKYQNKTFEAGTVDDSVIDYDDEGKGEINWSDLTSDEQKQVAISKGFANVFGVNVVYFASKADKNGEFKGENGRYEPSENTIYLDVHAGRMTADEVGAYIVPTMSHEITHWAEKKAPELFSKLGNHVLTTIAKEDGVTVQELLDNEKRNIKKSLEKRGKASTDISDEYAMSEIVARACEDMLSNSAKAKEMLSGLSESEQKTFIAKIKETIKNFIEWVNEILSKLNSKSHEAQIMQKNKEAFEKALKMWEEMQIQAIQTNQSMKAEGKADIDLINEATEEVGVSVDADTQSAYPNLQQFSERTWTESEYVQNREKAIKELAKALGITKEQAGNYIDNINGIARLIADDRVRLDYEPNIDGHATVVKPNSEYVWTVDMSTLCAKRLLFTGTFDEIQRQLPNTPLDSDDIVTIRAMMKEDKLEVACGICYVESTRREIGTITNDFIERYKLAQKSGKPITRINSSGKEVELKKTKDQKETTVDKTTDNFYPEEGYTPTLAELNTTDIDIIKRDHPLVYEAYLNFMNARGQAKPKLLETRAEYKGEILTHFKSKSAVDARNKAGGLRLQSFSDFETPHLIDMMQIITDMARVGLKSQAYTKVVNFAEAFGNTGVKINLSLIAKDSGLDADGNLIFDDVEGINHEEAFRLRNKYSKNVGTILVGKNDEHIIKAMADPRIDYIIPFHKSSWKESLYDALGLNGYDDYTDTQNEKPIDKSRKIKNFDPSEYWRFDKTGEENAQIYLEKCKADGRIPKFPQFQSYEGYWKLLIDFKMYDNDGVGSPQTTVTPDFNMEECNRILNEYRGGHRNFPVAKSVVDRFVSEYKQNHPQTQYSERYSYEALTNKEDMHVTMVQSVGDIDRKAVVEQAITNAKENGFTNENGNAVIHVDDIERDVIVPKHSITHGMDRRFVNQAPVFVRIGEVLKNSIRINELNPRSENISDTYALVGVASDGTSFYTVSFVVNSYTGEVDKIDVLYSANTKKESAALLPTITKQSFATPTDSTISIANLLDLVNEHFPDILPEDVLKHYGHTSRPDGKLGKDALYSDREIDSWLDALSIDDLLAEYGFSDFDAADTNVPTKKKERAKRRVDEANKRLKAIGLTFNGTKSLAWTDERIDKYLGGGFYGSSNPNYAQAYITYMTPQQFLNLTTGGKNVTLDMIENESQSYGELDIEKLGDSVPLFLEIREGKVWSKVVGHEGRHRMYLLGKAGFEKVPVLLFDSETKYSKTAKDEMKLIAQKYNDKDLISKSRNTTINDAVPFGTGNRDLIVEKFGSGNMKADIHYSDRDTDYIPTRTLLSSALESVAQTDKEKELLAEYRKNVDVIGMKESELAEINAKIKDILFTPGPRDTEKLEYWKKRAEKISNSINWFDKKLLSLEATSPLKALVERERFKAAKNARQKAYEKNREYNAIHKENAQKRAKIESITEKAMTLNDWLRRNSKDKHIPEAMKPIVINLLQAIDFSSKQYLGMIGGENKGNPTNKDISLADALRSVKDMVADGVIDDTVLFELYGDDLSESMKNLVSDVEGYARTVGDNEYVLNKMSLEELQKLDMIVGAIKSSVTKMNRFHVVETRAGIDQTAKQDIDYMKSLGQIKLHKGKLASGISQMLNWGNATPYYAFKRFGEGGQKIFEALMSGWDKFAFNVKHIIDYSEETYKEQEVKDWSKEVHEFDVVLPASKEELADPSFKGNTEKIKMTTAQIMSLYCLQKREQAKGHIFGGGIRITDIETKDGIISQSEGVLLTSSELERIISTLSEREIAVADALQKFMNEDCTAWGNEISMKRFGYKAFGEENYFPIRSDENVTGDGDVKEDNKSLYRLLNMSFTKALTEKANNRIVVDNIFDVFAQHTSDMAKYNALALPVLDAARWFNYKEKTEKVEGSFKTPSLRTAMEKAFGKDAENYVRTFLKDINGTDNVGRDRLAKGFMSKAKLASVGFNMKVVALQPTSYLRASTILDNKYLVKALAGKPMISLAEKWCGIAQWKSLGFIDINVQRGVADLIKHERSTRDKISEASMKGAELADKVTLGYLWKACEYEMREKHPELAANSDVNNENDSFYTMVGKRLREVIYATQVVDSTMTRSHMMRSGDTKDKILTNFASEPTLSYNMLMDAYYNFVITKRKDGKTFTKGNMKKLGRTMYAYTVTSAITALIEMGFALFRDDEEKEPEEMMKLYLENLYSNMSVLSKIPYLKEAISILQGYTSSNMDTQWMQYFAYSIKGVGKLMEGEGNAYTTMRNALKGISYATGVPLFNIGRDIISAFDKTGLLSFEDLEDMFNETIGDAFPSLKTKK